MGLDRLCDIVIWVKAPILTRYLRAKKRDGLAFGQVLQRIWRQNAIHPQGLSTQVDIYKVNNAGRLEETAQKVHQYLNQRGLLDHPQ